jgi:hypothetical protein
MDESLREHGMVIVDNEQIDVLHFQSRHPWNDAHDDDGEHHDHLGQKRVVAYLREFFL